MVSSNCLVTNIQNILVCLQQKKETHTGLINVWFGLLFIYLFITICKIFIFCIYSYYYNLKYTKVDIQYN